MKLHFDLEEGDVITLNGNHYRVKGFEYEEGKEVAVLGSKTLNERRETKSALQNMILLSGAFQRIKEDYIGDA